MAVNRDTLVHLVSTGQSVNWRGRVLSRVEELPSQAEIDRHEENVLLADALSQTGHAADKALARELDPDRHP